jgi:hypothetical protein
MGVAEHAYEALGEHAGGRYAWGGGTENAHRGIDFACIEHLDGALARDERPHPQRHARRGNRKRAQEPRLTRP